MSTTPSIWESAEFILSQFPYPRSMVPSSRDPGIGSRETEHYDMTDGGAVRCRVCPRTCVIPDGESGICDARENRDG